MSLRRPQRRDMAALSGWLPACAAEARCDAWVDSEALRTAADTGGALVWEEPAGTAFVAFDTVAPRAGAAQVGFLAVEPGRRRTGVGARAALALERRLRRTARELYVFVPERLGLALYFWLRLGYRPLTQAESPAGAGGAGIWMVRELNRAASGARR